MRPKPSPLILWLLSSTMSFRDVALALRSLLHFTFPAGGALCVCRFHSIGVRLPFSTAPHLTSLGNEPLQSRRYLVCVYHPFFLCFYDVSCLLCFSVVLQ
ncbi:hypothetical protein PYCCODRAFT_83673 [Trametes coccinea BRFM310]|uniref:Uncharacterized protein n=1 Tax=Trametes coccinea (strain BRFM310) TaxID=1353009 RepID=A0A1Y2IUS6_TRAC3|nr:hypothetical protein PYCCODRAFT_83673 [Trametes coccinea BRFM310]